MHTLPAADALLTGANTRVFRTCAKSEFLADTSTVFHCAELVDRVGDDAALARAAVGAFLKDCPVRLAAIQTAIGVGDPEQLQTAAHALKGAAATISAGQVAAAAGALEAAGHGADLASAGVLWQQLQDASGALTPLLTRFSHGAGLDASERT